MLNIGKINLYLTKEEWEFSRYGHVIIRLSYNFLTDPLINLQKKYYIVMEFKFLIKVFIGTESILLTILNI